MRKVLNVLFALVLFTSALFGVDFFAKADSVYNSPTLTLNRLLLTENYNGATNMGGMCIQTTNNHVFVVKSNSGQEDGALYYYNNIFNSQFKNESNLKHPKRIKFFNGLLGHANSMAIDNNYLYVTMWKSGMSNYGANRYTNHILRISRAAINEVSDGFSVTSVNTYTPNGIKFCEEITPKYASTNTTYDRFIRAITTYYKSSTIDKFIVDYGYQSSNGIANKILKYTIATYNKTTNEFTVSTDPNDLFTVNNPLVQDSTMQSIFYDSTYGFFIPIWYNEGTPSVRNRILKVDISDLDGNTNGSLTFNPNKTIIVNESSNNYKRFELESVAIININSQGNPMLPRIVFSANTIRADNSHLYDEIVAISNSGYYLN